MELDLKKARESSGLELIARQLVQGFMIGLHQSPYHGFSVEFAEHRQYNQGDSSRHIDWKVYARTDKLFTKKYEEETNLRCMILVDTSSSMNYPAEKSKLLFSIQSAAALAYLLHKQRDAVGITLFSDKVDVSTPIKSSGIHLNKLFSILDEQLRQTSEAKPTHVTRVIHEMAEKIHTRSLVILFTDLFDNETDLDEIFKSLQHLKHGKNEVLLFHVTDHATEKQFQFDEKLYTFRDLESGLKITLQPNEVKKSFQEKLKNQYQEIVARCLQLKIDFVTADCRGNYHDVLQAYLIKRAKMP